MTTAGPYCVPFRFSFPAFLASAWVFCAAQGQPDLVLTEQDNGKTVVAMVGQSIAIDLRGNPSTGYTWVLARTEGDSILSAGSYDYIPDTGGGVGAGGTFRFPFRASEPGSTTLLFEYLQPWDPGSIAHTFSVTISVASGGLPPRLTIEFINGDVVVRWPISGSEGFCLEGTLEITPANWTAPNVVVVAEGDQFKVTLPASGKAAFFRLRK